MSIENPLCTAVAEGPFALIYFLGGLIILMGFNLCVIAALWLWLTLLYRSVTKRNPKTQKTTFAALVLLIAGVSLMNIDITFIALMGMGCVLAAMALIFKSEEELGLGKKKKYLLRFLAICAVFFFWMIMTDCFVWYA